MTMSKLQVALSLVLSITTIGVTQAASLQERRKAEGSRPSEEKKKPKSDKEKIQGRWLLISREQNGKRQAPLNRQTISFEADNLVTNYPAERPLVVTDKYALKSGLKPKVIDRIGRNEDTPGIYSLEEDRLTICWGKARIQRPKEFDTKPGSGFTLEVYKRLPDEGSSIGTETWNRETALRFPYQPTCVAFGPDGKTLVTAGFDDGFPILDPHEGGPGRITLWDLSQEKEKGRFDLGMGMYFSVISPDAQLLATEHRNEKSLSGRIVLWDSARGEERSSLGASESKVRSLAFGRDGLTLAAGYYDGMARLFKVSAKDKTEIAGIPKAQEGGVTCLALSPDNKVLATGGYDASIQLWEVSTRKSLGILRGHLERLIAVTYSSDGKFLASVSGDGAVKVWEVSTLKTKATFQGIREVRALAFSPDGRTLAYCSSEVGKDGEPVNLVKLFDLITGKEKAIIKARMDCPKALAFSRDGKKLALAGELYGGKIVIGDQSSVILWKLEE